MPSGGKVHTALVSDGDSSDYLGDLTPGGGTSEEDGELSNEPSADAIKKGMGGRRMSAQTSMHVVKKTHELYENAKAVGAARGKARKSSFNLDGSSRAGVELTEANRPRFAHEAAWIINPKGTFSRRWDVLMVFLLLFTAVVTPYETAFLETKLNFLFFFNRAVDLLFLTDLFINFFLSYPDPETQQDVVSHKRIAKHYLTGWFTIDFVSILPFDSLGLAMDSSDISQLKIMRVLRLLRLFKLMRIFKSSRIFKRWEAQMSMSYAQLALIKFFILVCATALWMACAFRVIVDVEDHRAADNPDVKANWLTTYGFHDPAWDESSLPTDASGDVTTEAAVHWQQFLVAIYWATMTITTIGYGDVASTTPAERVAATTCMLLGASVYAYVCNTHTHTFDAIDAIDTFFPRLSAIADMLTSSVSLLLVSHFLSCFRCLLSFLSFSQVRHR